MKRYEILAGIEKGIITEGMKFTSESHGEKIEVKRYKDNDELLALYWEHTTIEVSMIHVPNEEWELNAEQRMIAVVGLVVDQLSLIAGRIADDRIEKDELHTSIINVINELEKSCVSEVNK